MIWTNKIQYHKNHFKEKILNKKKKILEKKVLVEILIILMMNK
jgi:hypothetical protein